jgi:serine/threonine protein kinase
MSRLGRQTGAGVGTPGYISPEELGGHRITTKSDTFSFAMILWEMLTSAVPFHDYLSGPGVTYSVAKLRSLEIASKNLRPPIPADKDACRDFGISSALYAEYTAVIRECWRRETTERPDFDTLERRLVGLHRAMHKFKVDQQEQRGK